MTVGLTIIAHHRDWPTAGGGVNSKRLWRRVTVPEPYQAGDHCHWTGRGDCYTQPEMEEVFTHRAFPLWHPPWL